MSRQPIVINDHVFRTQKEANVFFSAMLSRYHNGQDITGDDFDMLYALLERHPEAKREIGCGVKRLYKDKTAWPQSCFWIERIDGSKTWFSFMAAVTARKRTLFQEFCEACRNAVNEDMRMTKRLFFKRYGNENGKVPCDITGEYILLSESHLDHKKPLTFQVIVITFINANEIQIVPEMFSTTPDINFQTSFVDHELRDKFRRYHHMTAQLRIIKAERNQGLGGSERILKIKCPVIIPLDLYNLE